MCEKKKLSKFECDLIISQSEMLRKRNNHFYRHSKRKERRKYWCDECKSYHLTSLWKK